MDFITLKDYFKVFPQVYHVTLYAFSLSPVMSSASGLHLEDVIKDIGGCGRFQITVSIIVHSMKCIVCFTMIFMVFGAAAPDWWCMDDLIGQNISDVTWKHNVSSYQSCESHNKTETCSRFHYDDSMKTVLTKVIFKLYVFKHSKM